MLRLIAAAAASSLMFLTALGVENTRNKDSEISGLLIRYHSLLRGVGAEHPAIETVRRKIGYCIDDGENKLDQLYLSNELDDTYKKYRELRDTVGLQHPSTQAALNRIRVVTRLMLADEVVTQENLEDFLRG